MYLTCSLIISEDIFNLPYEDFASTWDRTQTVLVEIQHVNISPNWTIMKSYKNYVFILRFLEFI